MTFNGPAYGAALSEIAKTKKLFFIISEDMVDVTLDDTKGVAPYNTGYGYTNITINPNSGIEWVEGAAYHFEVNTKLVVPSANRNVRIRIGEDEEWKPLMGGTSILSGQTYFTKSYSTLFYYRSTYIDDGALYLHTDANTTYTYLVNNVTADATESPIKIDDNGYGAKYSLIFPTTPIANALDGNERWSSPMLSSSSGTTKKAFTKKLYLDRAPLFINSANVAAGGKPTSSLYQAYSGQSLFNYLANTSSSYVIARKRCYMWLKDFDETDMSFYADPTVGNVMSENKIKTRFPASTSGDVYLLYLGWNTSTWYNWQPDFISHYKIYKYTPSTGAFVDTGIKVG